MCLEHLGAHVQGYALQPPTDPSMYDVCNLGKRIESRIGDIRDLDALTAALEAGMPEVVFHLAAQPIVRRSYRDPIETYSTNVMGTVNILEACRRTPSVDAVVIVTSDKCYENQEWEYPYREIDQLGGRDPYSSSKACAELVSAAYARSFFCGAGGSNEARVATARAGNVIGGGDWAEDRLVPDIARAMAGRRPIEVRNPASVRPWQHVLEPVWGYLVLGEWLLSMPTGFAGAFNFGPDSAGIRSVGEIAGMAIESWGAPGAIRGPESDAIQPHEARLLTLDSSKAAATLGWCPALDTRTAVELTVEWYRSYYENPDDAEAVTVSQVEDYLRRTEAVRLGRD